MNPFTFVHIPKTAGTSFRLGVDTIFGADRVCRDYGAKSPATSEIVNQWMVKTPDKWMFKKKFDRAGYEFLSGHIRAIDYAPLFGVERMITFVREPLQRLVSEYNHVVRHYDFKGSFEQFYRAGHNVNRQQRALAQVPWPAIGFIGLTEMYVESLVLLQRKYGLEIPSLQGNQARGDLSERYAVSAEHKAELRELNAADIALYQRVRSQFEWRLKLSEIGQSFVAGMLVHAKNGQLFGWAVADEGDDAVVVQARVDGEVVGEAVANDDRPGLRAMGIARGGFVGFSLDISNLKAGDMVECLVASTGQPLVGSPWKLQPQA